MHPVVPTLLLVLLAGSAPAALLEAPSATYATVQDALTAATSGDVVRVKRGSYTGAIALKRGVTLEGEETADTTLRGTVTWANGAILRRVTLNGAGLTLTAITEGTIENCIFRGTTGTGTALTLTNCRLGSGPAGSLRISRNTFYDNGTALKASSTDEVAEVSFNLFASNDVAVEVQEGSLDLPTLTGNNFWDNGADGTVGVGNTAHDPDFLDAAGNPPDLHTTAASEARDRGAYSGERSDPTPPPPEGVTATLQDDGRTVTVAWDQNRAYNVTVDSYALSLSRVKGGDGDEFETVPAADPSEEGPYSRSLDLRPPVPASVKASPRDGALHVSWAKDFRADGYKVRIGTSVAGAQVGEVDAGDVSSYEREGLTNGTAYYVSVQAYAEGDRYVSVTAVASEDDTTWKSRPAEATKVAVSQRSEFSSDVSVTPAPITGFPPLDDNGACFLGSLARGRAAQAPASRRGADLALLGTLAVAALLSTPRRRRRLAGAVAAAGFLLAPAPVVGKEPRWVASAAGGVFRPDQDGWNDAYDHRSVPHGRVGLGFRPLRQLEVGVDAGYWRAEGDVRETTDGQPLDPTLEQTLDVFPLQAYLLVNLHFWDRQWVVPYVAGGYSYLFYRHEVDEGDTVRGHATGAHGRAGLKVYLNLWEPEAAGRARESYGLKRSYVFAEAQMLHADPSGEADLSGLSYLGGISLEF